MEPASISWDINNVTEFVGVWEKIVSDHSIQSFSTYTNSVLRNGALDDDIIKCDLPNDYMVVAAGRYYRDQVHIAGLTSQLEGVLYPHTHMTATTKSVYDKIRLEYLNNTERTISFFFQRMTTGTRAFFDSLPELQVARQAKDLIRVVQILKNRGHIGTGDVAEARMRLEQMIYGRDSTLFLSSAGESGYDFDQWYDTWRKLRVALRGFETNLSDIDFSKAFINSLPLKGIAVKASMLAPDALPETLDAAAIRIRSIIIHMRYPLSDCRGAFGVQEVVTGKKNKNAPTDEAGESAKPRNASDEALEKMVARVDMLTSTVSQMRDGQAGGGGHGAGRGRGGRGDGGRGDEDKKFDINCKAYSKNGVCTYEQEKKKRCRYIHPPPFTNVGGILRPLIVKPSNTSSAK